MFSQISCVKRAPYYIKIICICTSMQAPAFAGMQYVEIQENLIFKLYFCKLQFYNKNIKNIEKHLQLEESINM